MSYRGSWRGNAAEKVARDEVDIVIARLMTQLGFTHGTHVTVDLLSDLAVRHIMKISQNVRLIKEHCGRTGAVVRDVEYAYDKMQIDVSEMNEYMRQNRPLSPRLIPQFPAVPFKKNSKISQIALSGERPDHIPSWAPPMYVPDMPIMASSSTTSVKCDTDFFPDFSSFSALSLGLERYREETKHGQPSRTASRSSESVAEESFQAEFVEPRPSSKSSATNAPMFKRRKTVKRPHTDHISNEPSTSSHGTMPVGRNAPVLFTAKELAHTHRPVMLAIHTGAAAPAHAHAKSAVDRTSSTVAKDLKPSTMTHGKLGEAYNSSLSPRRAVQMAILKSMFVLDAELPDELKKAFDYINEPEQNFTSISTPQLQALPSSSEPVYRIIPQESLQENPPGTLPPLKIKISRASLSGDPSPAVLTHSSSSGPSSPKPKRHKHKKKKKHKKDKDRDVEMPPAEENPQPQESYRPIKLKIRLGPPST